MAILIGSVLGNFRGKLGNLAARIIEGRTIFAARPSSYDDPMTPEQIDYRSKLGTAAKFSSGINNVLTLRKLWKKMRPPLMSAFSYMVQQNVKLVGTEAPTADCITSPPNGFLYSSADLTVAEANVTATIPALDTFISLPPEASGVKFAGVISYGDPINEGMEEFVVTPIEKEVEGYNFSAQYSLTIPLSSVQVNLATLYQRKTVYLGLIVTDEGGSEVIAHSDSISAVV
ncbi:MAG TPA: hypothetical protein PLT92_06085 [Ignavibacteriaceae bacterium]|nr:hypothetical protein [Ignavibacteriaceae bacterium]